MGGERKCPPHKNTGSESDIGGEQCGEGERERESCIFDSSSLTVVHA